MPESPETDLPELLEHVKRELRIAQQNARESPVGPSFSLRRVQMEISVLVKRSTEKNGGLCLQVVSASGKTSDENQRSHKLLLDFDVSPEGNDTRYLKRHGQ